MVIMKKRNRTTALLLAALMLSAQAALTSCSDNGEAVDGADTRNSSEQENVNESSAGAESESETETEADPSLKDDLPTDMKDYDGRDFTVVGYDYTGGAIAWHVVDIYSETLTGERVNDSVYERNSKIEDRFGVKIKENLQKDPNSYAKQVSASSDEFQLLQTDIINLASLATQGYLLNLKEFDYIDFDKAWWDKTANDSLSILGRTYYAIGDSQLNAKKATWVVLFNKKLTNDADLPDLYAEVREGKWTLDNLKKYGMVIAQDANGDGEMVWEDDVFGIGLQYDVSSPLLLGTGERVVTIEDDGTYEYLLGSEANMNTLEKIWEFFNKDKTCLINWNDHQSRPNIWVEARNLFMADQVGFYMTHLGTVVLVGGDMQSDFGILPIPKVNEYQEDYCSSFQYYNANAVGAMKSTKDTAFTGLITEAYEMYAHDTVLPAYYTYTLTHRNARDEESGEMLDIIFKKRNLDITFAFDKETGIQSTISGVVKSESYNFASTEKAKRKLMTKQIDKIIASFESLDD